MSERPTAKVEVWRKIDGKWKIVLVDIPLDKIDDPAVIDACSNGQCDELAITLRELRGFTLMGIFVASKAGLPKECDTKFRTVAELREAYPETWVNAWVHTLVRIQDGDHTNQDKILLDIHGLLSEDDWRDEYDGSCAILTMTEQDIDDALEQIKNHQPRNLDVIRQIAPLVLEKYKV